MHASPPIQLHVLAACAAVALSAMQFAGVKGTAVHRTLGWAWIVAMATVALSSFFVHTICSVGSFSLIHLLSIFTLVMLPQVALHARRHAVRAHRQAVSGLVIGGLAIAGVLTFWPGRIMHDVLLGSASTDNPPVLQCRQGLSK